MTCWCTNALAGLGVAALVYILVKSYQFIHASFLAGSDVAKYRKFGDWAIVTGGSDGIGKEMALQLAKKKYNVFLVARNKEKLQEAAKEIMLASSGSEVRVVVLDFSTATAENYARAFEEIGKEKVSVLVNNAGVSYEHMEFFAEVPVSVDVNMLKVNCESQLYFAKWFIKHVIDRKAGGGAMVNLASISATVPAPLLSWYAGTKALNRVFSNCLALEVAKHKIDVLTLTPGFVCTKMTGITRSSFLHVMPTPMVKQSLSKIGGVTEDCGHWHHTLFQWFVNALPASLANGQSLSLGVATRAKFLKRKAAKAAETAKKQ